MPPGDENGGDAPGPSPSDDEDRLRLEAELEFVQLLANPLYLNHLAQNKYLEDPAFVHYLAYLRYWREPAYARLVIFPQCLFFLELLQEKRFRDMLVDNAFVDWLLNQQYHYWLSRGCCDQHAAAAINSDAREATGSLEAGK